MFSTEISVVIPVYGVEKYIKNCLQSILNQTFRAFEIVLVDDGSKDASIETAQQVLQDADVPVRIFRQENQGQGAARDHGIREAVGKYVICVDSDDTVAPDFLETLYREAERGNRDLCFCGLQMVGEGNENVFSSERVPFEVLTQDEMLHNFLCRKITPLLPAMLIRRDLIVKNQLCCAKGCRFSEDLYFMWLLFSVAERISYSKSPLYNYLRREGSTMTSARQRNILTGYDAFCALLEHPKLNNSFDGAELLLPRWVLGALNSSARICSYPAFMDIAGAMNYQAHMRKLRKFPDVKARILAALLLSAPKLYYRILH